MLPSPLKRNVFVGHPVLPLVTVLPVAQFLQHPEPSSGESPPTRSGHGSATTYPPPIGWTGGVPSGVEIEKWRILPVGSPTTNRPSGKTAAGGMRHGEAYQEVGAAA